MDLLEQEIMSGSGISWATCKSALHPRQITTPTSQHSVFYRPDALPTAQPTASKQWRSHTSYSKVYFPVLEICIPMANFNSLQGSLDHESAPLPNELTTGLDVFAHLIRVPETALNVFFNRKYLVHIKVYS